jgi:predicted esterase YcpF (UPF0227 family)
MKKILYLHGLDAIPKPEKVSILEKAGNVMAPRINYRAFIGDITLFNELSDAITIERITHIVGSSFGGYMGFYLSEFCKIPGVLFNPALSYKSLDVPVIKSYSDTRKTIILGIYDDVVDPKMTKRFVEENQFHNIEIVELPFGHQVSEENFKLALKYLK